MLCDLAKSTTPPACQLGCFEQYTLFGLSQARLFGDGIFNGSNTVLLQGFSGSVSMVGTSQALHEWIDLVAFGGAFLHFKVLASLSTSAKTVTPRVPKPPTYLSSSAPP
jgi:hypothetical protein